MRISVATLALSGATLVSAQVFPVGAATTDPDAAATTFPGGSTTTVPDEAMTTYPSDPGEGFYGDGGYPPPYPSDPGEGYYGDGGEDYGDGGEYYGGGYPSGYTASVVTTCVEVTITEYVFTWLRAFSLCGRMTPHVKWLSQVAIFKQADHNML